MGASFPRADHSRSDGIVPHAPRTLDHAACPRRHRHARGRSGTRPARICGQRLVAERTRTSRFSQRGGQICLLPAQILAETSLHGPPRSDSCASSAARPAPIATVTVSIAFVLLALLLGATPVLLLREAPGATGLVAA